MSSVNFDYWLESLVLSIPMAEPELLRYETRAAAIEFCNLSEAWRMELLPFNLQVGIDTYYLDPPVSKTEISKIVDVSFKTQEIDYVLTSANVFKLAKKPDDATNQVTMLAAIRPSRDAEVMDGEVAKRYFDGILDGIKARLYAMPQKPWSDGPASVFYRSKMEHVASIARRESTVGHGRVPLRTKLHLFNGR